MLFSCTNTTELYNLHLFVLILAVVVSINDLGASWIHSRFTFTRVKDAA